MRKRIAIISLLVVVIVSVGFSLTVREQAAELKTLNIEKQIGTRNYYKKVKTITEQDKIDAFFDILVRANWENVEVSMTLPPAYKINKLYTIWINPQMNRIEVVITGKSKYTKLSKKDSKTLLEMIKN